jgi:hypothetical protein
VVYISTIAVSQRTPTVLTSLCVPPAFDVSLLLLPSRDGVDVLTFQMWASLKTPYGYYDVENAF